MLISFGEVPWDVHTNNAMSMYYCLLVLTQSVG